MYCERVYHYIEDCWCLCLMRTSESGKGKRRQGGECDVIFGVGK